MTLTVLSDDQVNTLLESLTLDELEDFRRTLASALHEFSTSPKDPFQQPHHISTHHSETKATTLYMPSCGPPGMGCKVVTLTTPASRTNPTDRGISPTGVVNLFNPDGSPIGLVHASTLTAFRTALASVCLLARRTHVHVLTVFGSGLQAYWHVRLALMMRGSTIKHVNVINRSFSTNAAGLIKKFTVIPNSVKEREGWTQTKFGLLTPTFHEYAQLQKEHVRDADVIYCCTPSTQDLFDGAILTSHEGRKKGRLIIAVGSYTPHMRELPEDLLLQAVKPQEKPHRHFHKHAIDGGVIVVDTLEGVLKEAGEIIHAKIGPHQLIELGELVMLRRLAIEENGSATTSNASLTSSVEKMDINDRTPSMSSIFGGSDTPSSPNSRSKSPFHFRKISGSSADSEKRKKDDALARWLRDGTVIYKSVGLGLMDLVVGMHLVEVAQEKGLGTHVDF